MKKAVSIFMVSLSLFAISYFGSNLEIQGTTLPSTAIKDPAMAQWEKNAAPGENHQVLDTLVGQWKHKVKWWKSPEVKPEESQGTNENHWILGKRFLQQDHQGQWMEKPFEGLGIIGYDNVRQEYTSVWLDNMSTGTMIATSHFDPATKTFKESGSFSCPMTGEKNETFRADWKILDNNHYSYDMYTKDKDGKEFKCMEITYERTR